MQQKQQSIMETMNTVIRQMNALPIAPSVKKEAKTTELEHFARLDALLKSLHKQYLDAQYTRQQHLKNFGADDPMAEIAADMEDSAWCAMQTRYLELRADRTLMAKVQDMQAAAQAQIAHMARAAEKTAQKKQEQKISALIQYGFILQNLRAKKKRRKQSKDNVLLWIWFLLMVLINAQTQRLTKSLSAFTSAARLNTLSHAA